MSPTSNDLGELEITYEHKASCRRCAILLAFRIVGDRPIVLNVDDYITRILRVARWIVAGGEPK